jgi:hypothetical protein
VCDRSAATQVLPATPIATATAIVIATAMPTIPTQQTTPDARRILARIPLTWKPTLLAVGEGYLWIASHEEQTIARFDPKTNQFVGTPMDVELSNGAL